MVRRSIRQRLCTAFATAAAMLFLTPSALASSRTTAPPPGVIVNVTITDSRIELSRTSAPRGAVARFVLVNRGSKLHSFLIGATGVQGGSRRVLEPGQKSVLLLFLDYRGKVSYGSSLPSDRAKPRMHGYFTII